MSRDHRAPGDRAPNQAPGRRAQPQAAAHDPRLQAQQVPTSRTVAFGSVATSPPVRAPATGRAPAAPPRGVPMTGPPTQNPGGRPAATSNAGPELTPGLRFEQYELIRELGRGGMGQVFLARDVRLGRKVAIKFLNDTSEAFAQRFLVEARATARCNHENIVVIHEVGTFQGMPFMVLEYLEGDELTNLIRGKRVPPTRAVELILPVVRALARAHEFGIVHRDLKPDNILVTHAGTVKVLDFGIAKACNQGDDPDVPVDVSQSMAAGADLSLTRDGAIMGTLPYMSPEQWGTEAIDHRTDLWAVGLILWEMVAGQHPLAGMNVNQLMANACFVNQPMESVAHSVPNLPSALVGVIDGCLRKLKADRIGSAQELVGLLEPLLPGRYGRRLAEDECPYPGLTAFQETDADRFFGRSRDIVQAVTRTRERPLIGVVGPSGVGKSSFVRAGVVPALKASGEAWDVLVTRPGRYPLDALATLLQPLLRSTSSDLDVKMAEHRALAERLRTEPGYLGTLLRGRARQMGGSILLFVDQFEELYTLVPSAEERAAYTACLAAVADDAAAPLRVVISMRSDFLDRVAEDRRFITELTPALVFLQPPDREGLREALTQPAEMAGYQFEAPEIVEEMLDALQHTPGALPLLQFTASRMWETRDRSRNLLTLASYRAMGGIAGALATHANEVLASFDPQAQKLVRAVFQRLVTPEGTRDIVDLRELTELSPESAEIRRIVDHLVQARLLVVQTRSEAEGPAVELVHESLITSWPALRRWLDEGQESAAFLQQLRTTAKQWEDRGRPQGLLWRGEAMDEARRWRGRLQGTLPEREQRYLDATFALADRSARIRRIAIVGTIAFLTVLVLLAGVALLSIRRAEREAKDKAVLARKEADRARAAEKNVKRQIEVIRTKEKEKQAAQAEAATGKKKLNMTYQQLEQALDRVKAEKVRAEEAKKRAEEASVKLRELLAKERERVKKLSRKRRRIATELD